MKTVLALALLMTAATANANTPAKSGDVGVLCVSKVSPYHSDNVGEAQRSITNALNQKDVRVNGAPYSSDTLVFKKPFFASAPALSTQMVGSTMLATICVTIVQQ